MSRQSGRFHGHELHRAALAIVVVLGHIGLIILLTRSTTFIHRPVPESPLLVTLVPAPSPAPEELMLPRPTVAFALLNGVPPPEFQVPSDIADSMSTAPPVARADRRPPEASSASPDPSPHLDVMSTVAYVQRPAPAYPRESRLAREEGLVILRVLIDESGHARDIDVYRSSGHPRLDKEACAAVARALFRPYVDGGIARAAIAMVPIEFSLRGKSS